MANGYTSAWPADRIEKLVDLQKRGWSFAQIAAELGNGITRNAVCGKLHRMGITSDVAAFSEEGRTRRASTAKARNDRANEKRRERRREWRAASPAPAREPVPLLTCIEIEPRRIPLLDLQPGDCRYPEGEGAGITFCGHPALTGRSYCGPHAALSLDCTKRRTRAEYEIYKRQNRVEQTQAILEAAE